MAQAPLDTGSREAYVDARHGFALEVPPRWDVRKGVAGLLVAIVDTSTSEGEFRASLNVVRKVRDRRPDLDVLARDALKALGRLLNDLMVIDIDSGVVADLPARRLLVAYRQGLFALTSEQWIVIDDDHIWTISAGATTDRWDDVADIFAAMVRSLRLTS